MRSGLPAVALWGEIVLIEIDPTSGAGEGEGCGIGDALLLPQPETMITAASNSPIADIRNMTGLPCLPLFRGGLETRAGCDGSS